MVACWPSHADSSSIRAARGGASSSNTSAGRRPCLPAKTVICRVRERITLDGRYRPPGTASRTRSHSSGVRLPGSHGHVRRTADVSPARQWAERRARPACSWAIRTIRSLALTPSAGATVQPSRRSAIHAFDGSFRPPASSPEAKTSTSAAFQCSASSSPAMPDTRSAAQPTRCASTAADSTTPVFSTTPVRSSPRAQAVRAVSPSPSGTFRLTGAPPLPAHGAVIRSTTLPRKGHPFDPRTHIRHRDRPDTRHYTDRRCITADDKGNT
jgi:hypothetical protein